MTELEKMMAGLPYCSRNDEMEALRARAKKICRMYNEIPGEESDRRFEVLKGFLGSIGEGSWIEPHFMVEYGSNIFMGKGLYINFDSIILDCAKVTIGDNVWFGPRVTIYTVDHSLDAEERLQSVCRCRPVTIGDNVWVGGSTTILGGVTIGKNSVIGGGSLVLKDIPEGVVAAGSPCRVIREITEADKLNWKP